MRLNSSVPNLACESTAYFQYITNPSLSRQERIRLRDSIPQGKPPPGHRKRPHRVARRLPEEKKGDYRGTRSNNPELVAPLHPPYPPPAGLVVEKRGKRASAVQPYRPPATPAGQNGDGEGTADDNLSDEEEYLLLGDDNGGAGDCQMSEDGSGGLPEEDSTASEASEGRVPSPPEAYNSGPSGSACSTQADQPSSSGTLKYDSS